MKATLQLALEAFETLTQYNMVRANIFRRFEPTCTGDYVDLREFREKAKPAITAIKEALAQPEQEPVAHPFEDKAVISSLSWAAGLIEQAYRECGGHNGADSWLMNYADKQGERIRQADHREWKKVNGRWRVKATPPQRTWVGLTDKEANELWESTDSDDDWELMKRTEAKLRSKNENRMG